MQMPHKGVPPLWTPAPGSSSVPATAHICPFQLWLLASFQDSFVSNFVLLDGWKDERENSNLRRQDFDRLGPSSTYFGQWKGEVDRLLSWTIPA
jgi:hypothetical protein